MRLGPSLTKVEDVLVPIYDGCLSKKKLLKALNNELGNDTLKFKYKTNPFIISKTLWVSGFYDIPENKRVIIMSHKPGAKEFYIDPSDFAFLISQTIKHETIHQRQEKYKYDNRYKPFRKNHSYKFKDDEAKYLCEPEEIQAYAHDIAIEMLYYYPNKNPLDVFKNIHRTRKLPSYNYYRSVFKKQNWQHVESQLLKSVKKWMPLATL